MANTKAKVKRTRPTNKVGRPLAYKNAEQMQKVIDQYFAQCRKQKHEKIRHTRKHVDEETGEIHTEQYYTLEPQFYADGEPVMEYVQPVTITGLARVLGMDRQRLIEYENRDEFYDTIKSARERVQEYVEHAMMGGLTHPTAAIFNLKNNYGWKDKTESEVTNTHLHLHAVSRASYQEADKLESNSEYARSSNFISQPATQIESGQTDNVQNATLPEAPKELPNVHNAQVVDQGEDDINSAKRNFEPQNMAKNIESVLQKGKQALESE